VVTPPTHMDDERDSRRRPTLRVLPGGASPGAGGTVPGAAAPVEHPGSLDGALLAAFLVGDDDAFGELVRRNEGLVLAIVRRYARSPEDARDLAQRTFLRAFEAARRAFRRGARSGVPFRRWLVRIAVNLAKNHLRDELRFPRAPLDALGSAAATTALAGDQLLRDERARRVRRAVLRLPRRQREVLTLRVDAELPFAEIAQTLGVSENAAKVSFHHATRRLRDALAAEDRP
jgi:RNA polymerase sigma-70 factor, ECF subfamily